MHVQETVPDKNDQSASIGQYDIAVDDAYKKVDFFPTVPPPRLDRNVYRDRALELDEHNAHRFKSPHLAKDILDTSGSYAFLKQRDVIRVAGHKPYGSNEEMFIEITHKHQIAASDYVNEHPEQLELVKSQIGRSPSATDKVTVLEFETVYPWELNDERSA